VFPDKKQSLAGKALINNDIYQKLLIFLLAACGWPGWVESLRGEKKQINLAKAPGTQRGLG
jgi:hypothetical protein